MNEEEAFKCVESGTDVWTQYESDARSLASRFPGSYRDKIHVDGDNKPGTKYTLDHYHDRKGWGHAHICFGYPVNDHNPNEILKLI